MTELTRLIYGGEPLTEDTSERWAEIRGLLEQHDCVVTFTKLDGSERTMLCTLRKAVLPPARLDEFNERFVNNTVLNVWDLEAQGWRAFRVANVRTVERTND